VSIRARVQRSIEFFEKAITMKYIRWTAVLTAVICAGSLPAQQPAASVTETTIYSFTGLSGSNPDSGLISDKNGALYGAVSLGGASNQGAVYQLMPPSMTGGSWTQTVLYSFAGGATDGANPYGALVFDNTGSLYGTTLAGGASNAGTIFQLKPPTVVGSPWTDTVLYSFTGGSDGGSPTGSLIFGSGINLYGTAITGGASNFGTVFELQHPTKIGGPWTYSVIYNFLGGNDGASPATGLTLGGGGKLFGTTYAGGPANAGTVFELTSVGSGQPWTETLLYSFTGGSDGGQPRGALVASPKAFYGSASYGGTSNAGTVYELTQPVAGGPWTFTVLYSFGSGKDGAGPYGNLLLHGGFLYGTTSFGGRFTDGTIYSLKPPTTGGAWTEVLLHNFVGNNGDGAEPFSGLVLSPNGSLYGTTFLGGPNGDGTVYQLTL
jgi:uncharacterized repeat protein (TIGR03803 family)